MNTQIILGTLGTMTRSQLRATARQLGCRTGRNTPDTIANIRSAIETNKARFTVQFTIRPNTNPTARTAPAIFVKKLRTHKPNKVLFAPAPSRS